MCQLCQPSLPRPDLAPEHGIIPGQPQEPEDGGHHPARLEHELLILHSEAPGAWPPEWADIGQWPANERARDNKEHYTQWGTGGTCLSRPFCRPPSSSRSPCSTFWDRPRGYRAGSRWWWCVCNGKGNCTFKVNAFTGCLVPMSVSTF